MVEGVLLLVPIVITFVILKWVWEFHRRGTQAVDRDHDRRQLPWAGRRRIAAPGVCGGADVGTGPWPAAVGLGPARVDVAADSQNRLRSRASAYPIVLGFRPIRLQAGGGDRVSPTGNLDAGIPDLDNDRQRWCPHGRSFTFPPPPHPTRDGWAILPIDEVYDTQMTVQGCHDHGALWRYRDARGDSDDRVPGGPAYVGRAPGNSVLAGLLTTAAQCRSTHCARATAPARLCPSGIASASLREEAPSPYKECGYATGHDGRGDQGRDQSAALTDLFHYSALVAFPAYPRQPGSRGRLGHPTPGVSASQWADRCERTSPSRTRPAWGVGVGVGV